MIVKTYNQNIGGTSMICVASAFLKFSRIEIGTFRLENLQIHGKYAHT